MKRRGVVALALTVALLAFEPSALAQSQSRHVEAVLIASSHRDLASARAGAAKVQQRLVASFVGEVGTPSPSIGAASTSRNQHGRLVFLDANGWRLDEPIRSSDLQLDVSIEDSGDFPGLVPGFLIVVIASGEPRTIWRLARRVNAAGVKSYVRYSQRVFSGCPY